MRTLLLTIAAAALMGGFAQANEAPVAPGQAADGQGPAPMVKVLYVCGEDEASWRSVSRDLGIPEFVTAKQVRADSGKAWDAPKCITPAELRRLTNTQVGRLSAAALMPVR
ncbi:MAG: hypothetical protein AB1942_20745 [Pseudomonadota bacterium]